MALNKKGIDKLEKVMLANRKRYSQNTYFANKQGCGTEMCAAGFCHLLIVGQERFDAQEHGSLRFAQECLESGVKLLGLKCHQSDCGDLFDYSRNWPDDLRKAYEKAKGPMPRVRLYIKMLRTRVNDDGTIREK